MTENEWFATRDFAAINAKLDAERAKISRTVSKTYSKQYQAWLQSTNRAAPVPHPWKEKDKA